MGAGRQDRRVAHVAIAGGICARAIYGLFLHPPLDHVTSDMAGYVQRAQRLGGGGVIPRIDYFMPPGTQLLLSLPMHIFGVGRAGLWGATVLWFLLSSAYPWLAWRWATQVLPPRGATMVAVCCALSPLAILYGGWFSSELPAMVLLPAVLLLMGRAAAGNRPSGYAAGAATAVLVVVRQQFVLNIVVVVVAVFAAYSARHSGAIFLRMLGGASVATVAIVALAAPPWQVQGTWVPLTGENGGLNFFYGHCDARKLTTPELFFVNPVREQRGTGTDVTVARRATEQGWFFERGLDCLKERPGRAIVLAARNVADLTATSIPFPPWTEGGPVLLVAETVNMLFCLLLVGLLVVAAPAIRRDRTVRLLYAHLGCLVLVALLFLGEPRYRIPYDLFGWALLGWVVADRERALAPGAVADRFKHSV